VKPFWIGEGQGRPHRGDSPNRLSDTLKAHDIRHEYHETEGGHTWIGGGIACKAIRN
jgi:predicted esterase